MKEKIKVISAKMCSGCNKVKQFIKENNLDIEVLELDKSEEAKQLVKKLGIKVVPTAIIDGKPYVISGKENSCLIVENQSEKKKICK